MRLGIHKREPDIPPGGRRFRAGSKSISGGLKREAGILDAWLALNDKGALPTIRERADFRKCGPSV